MEYGNLAYKLEPEIEVEEVREVSKAPKQKMNFKIILFAIIISVSAYFMISKQVMLYETDKEISSLEKKLAELQSQEVQRNFELEQSIDLATIEEIATTKLNMQRPDQNQKVYVNITSDDTTEITSAEKESVKNKVSGLADNIKKNIIGIFSMSW